MHQKDEKEVIEFFSFCKKLIEDKIISRNETGSYELDLNSLKEVDPEIYDYFFDKPEKILETIKEALKLVDKSINRIIIKNFSDVKPISSIRVKDLGKLVRVIGMISKTTKVIALVKSTSFECGVCGSVITPPNNEKPKMCTCGSRGLKVSKKVLQNIQEIEVEELQDELEDGRQPQKIRIRLLDELCDRDISGVLQPGNKIETIGVVQKVPVYKTKKDDENADEIFEYRVLAINVNSLEEKFQEEYLSDEDLQQIHEISAIEPLTKLSQSLTPSIHGHTEIKKALILQMVGGVKKEKSDGNYSRDRMHILLCGEPSTGKSHLAKDVKLRVPKSYYISGDETSKAGLVCIVDKDELSGQWSLKAGALSKANDSVLIIDEIDKLSDEDRMGLHTQMESGIIVVNKADIHTSLNSTCSILAISNPKDGMFSDDPEVPITKQINLPPPIVTRFDLIFIMRDVIDEENDSSIVDIVYSGKKFKGDINIELFRKYITFAKKLRPVLQDENKKKLKDFYHKIRALSISENKKVSMPIAIRHLEGLIRMAEAHAKIRLSDKVEEKDVDAAIELFQNSLLKLGMDEKGRIDFARIGEGKTLSKKFKAKMMVELLTDLLQSSGGDYVKEEYLKEKALENGVHRFEF